MVEHGTENAGVDSSSLSLGTIPPSPRKSVLNPSFRLPRTSRMPRLVSVRRRRQLLPGSTIGPKSRGKLPARLTYATQEPLDSLTLLSGPSPAKRKARSPPKGERAIYAIMKSRCPVPLGGATPSGCFRTAGGTCFGGNGTLGPESSQPPRRRPPLPIGLRGPGDRRSGSRI